MNILSNLTGRVFSVQVGNSISVKKPLHRVVPLGSVLGPILFCIYTSVLSQLLSKHDVISKLYAYDTQFYMAMSNIEDGQEKLNNVMLDVKHWMDGEQLKLDTDKTECMIVGRENKLTKFDASSLQVCGDRMHAKSELKNLGA